MNIFYTKSFTSIIRNIIITGSAVLFTLPLFSADNDFEEYMKKLNYGFKKPASVDKNIINKAEEAIKKLSLKNKSAKPRKVLLYGVSHGPHRTTIPSAMLVMQSLGKITGAYEAVISSDMAMFKPENLKQFDAVCLNNTTKLDFSDGQLRKSLMDFVTGGKGLVGIHAASDNF